MVKKLKKERTDGVETRQNLLIAAGKVFAQKGYWETTNADICGEAKANIAAVNYHFRSKENLYIEAWKYSFEKSIAKYPIDGGVANNAPAKERLRGHIISFMRRISDPECIDVEIIHKEMANPTGILNDAIHSVMEKIDVELTGILRAILGEKITERQLRLCHMSMMGQCFGPMLHLRHRNDDRPRPKPKNMPIDFTIEELGDHIINFSIAGMNKIREDAEKKTSGKRK